MSLTFYFSCLREGAGQVRANMVSVVILRQACLQGWYLIGTSTLSFRRLPKLSEQLKAVHCG